MYVVTNASDVAHCLDEGRSGIRFDLTATVVSPCDKTGHDQAIAVADQSGTAVIGRFPIRAGIALSSGDRIKVRGIISPGEKRPMPEAIADDFHFLGHGPAVEPETLAINKLTSDHFNGNAITIQGTVRDAFRDEIDSRVYILILEADGATAYVTFLSSEDESATCMEFMNADVTVSGIGRTSTGSSRPLFGRHIHAPDKSHIVVMHPPEDAFDVPLLTYRHSTTPADIIRLGRRRIRGRVVAIWKQSNILVKTETGEPVIIELSFGRAPPACGMCIEAVGYPTTDLYHVNLTSAIWRPHENLAVPDDPIEDVLISQLLSAPDGSTVIRPDFHGKSLRLIGRVTSVPDEGNLNGALYLENDGFQIPVDCSMIREVCSGLRVGSTVRVTGTCVVNTEKWHPNESFPHATGLSLILRNASDLILLEPPSWWTRTRLLTAFAFLLFALVGILVWNRILHHLVERRGRELFKASVDRVSAGLRVEERTRLAAELHDSISQSLASLACQISAARRILQVSPDASDRLLIASEGLLQSCRTELRQCLYDLRNDTLELPDFSAAIHQTLEPVVGSAKLSVRFAVPRHRLRDLTAHTILCILRELAGNAVRHGQATAVKVAGSLEPGRLLFSVTDNGTGFDPAIAPGISEGHFGLDGIRTRVHRLNGMFNLESAPGKGTYAVIIIPLKAPMHEKNQDSAR